MPAGDFDYQHQSNWYDVNDQCSFNRQSPIELSFEEVCKLKLNLSVWFIDLLRVDFVILNYWNLNGSLKIFTGIF